MCSSESGRLLCGCCFAWREGSTENPPTQPFRRGIPLAPARAHRRGSSQIHRARTALLGSINTPTPPSSFQPSAPAPSALVVFCANRRLRERTTIQRKKEREKNQTSALNARASQRKHTPTGPPPRLIESLIASSPHRSPPARPSRARKPCSFANQHHPSHLSSRPPRSARAPPLIPHPPLLENPPPKPRKLDTPSLAPQ